MGDNLGGILFWSPALAKMAIWAGVQKFSLGDNKGRRPQVTDIINGWQNNMILNHKTAKKKKRERAWEL